jgi:hypothetical protein
MIQTCSKCTRVNPAGAAYCYFDGVVLGNGDRRGGPVAVGARSFPSPFVFPSGRTCRSFDELARGCQDDWTTARELLEKGYLETFLGGVGRLDLANAARESARFPDRDRGLDQLLSRLPSDVLADPKLRVDPLEVNLGVLKPGEDRTFELHLENQGERLVYGSVTCADGIWLGLGDAAASEKHFQFTQELTIPVRILGYRLQARKKVQEANLIVESNGGQVVVVVRCEVPITPFPNGILAGAKTPRQVAELCMKNPKEAGPLFEAGEVEKWYQSNGWVYPVKIPAASGLAAVQQFFEALGFTKPPRVEINTRELVFEARPGDTLSATLEVSSQEKKPIYAHGTSDVRWAEVGRARCSGRLATIALSIPSVPNKPGQTLQGQITVQANGNKRFVVPVRILVESSQFDFSNGSPAEVEPLPEAAFTPAADSFTPGVPPRLDLPERPSLRRKRGTPVLAHAIPAFLLLAAVLGVVGYDLVRRFIFPLSAEVAATDTGGAAELSWNYDPNKLRDKEPRLSVQLADFDKRFGIVLQERGVKTASKRKKLTYDVQGKTNNTCVKINGAEYLFGDTVNKNCTWIQKEKRVPEPRRGWISKARFNEQQVVVTQHIEIVPSETGLLDTCLVYYTMTNVGQGDQDVGIRVLIDTFIGANDGVPFTVPGRKGFVTKQDSFTGSDVPDYVEAVEKPEDSTDPGTTVRMTLRGIKLPGIDLNPPDRLLICRYPGNPAIKWDWTPQDMGPDSAVAIYWDEQRLEPGKSRQVAFTYGLGTLDVGDLLAVSTPSNVIPGREFIVTAYVYEAKKGQKVSLELPEGLILAGEETNEKTIEEESNRTQVFWKVKASATGRYEIFATSGRARSRARVVEVRATSIFG